MTPVLGPRALNRATLARQLLLERADLDPVDAVAHLAGLQAQTPQTWYVGLWSRLAGFDPAAVGTALQDRRLVRVPLMRSTIHLVTAADALAWRPLVDVVIERSTTGVFGRRLAGVDRAALVDRARELTTGRPMAAAELGRALAGRFPGHDPDALAQGARMWLPMVQVPPRGVWGRSGRPLQTPLEHWLGRAQAPVPVADLVLRYLAAFGPATVRDVQTWCGLTRLAEVVDDLPLATFRTEDGRALVDLPDAPRPDPDVPAPVRFLYDFDNLLLSHADRSRIVGTVDYRTLGFGGDSGEQPSSVLVDGVVAATWRAVRVRGAATLTVRPFRVLTPGERDAVTAEGAALLAFLHPRAAPEVVVG
ncbi:winged helix DNA-binding domain-containing protein [Pseudonocardia broussonetiae]|uniref:Winged helix DNA-binding domain-containing protein n=1 Tax=Pseudonocardia broussonetiae TaxID=2736640 RepID=A0A6M6JQP4_9PSEU|nr:winged helix DNA-binding domain-containing protein [Pseudonocardia broussonetiae]QJY48729.1 winged helix DNA-binding domain-containing protein [Pseudonocardia broussonetiae]